MIIKLAAGRAGSHEVTRATGSPDVPIPDDALDAKFRDCAMNAVVPIPPGSIESTIAFVRNLMRQPDACGLLSGLGESGRTA